MTRRLAVPAVVARGEDREAADHALATLLVAVEQIDGEGPALGESAQKPGRSGSAGSRYAASPKARIRRRDVQINGEAPKVFRIGVGLVGKYPLGHRVPAVQQRDTAHDVAQPHGQIDHIVLRLEDGPPAADPDSVLIGPHDLKVGIDRRDGTSRGIMPMNIVCSAMRADRFDDRTAENIADREHQRSARSSKRGDRLPIRHDAPPNRWL